MTYLRVIPRDLFNEANLLKCMGRIYINLENLNLPHVSLSHDGEAFRIEQNEATGGLIVDNVRLTVRDEFCWLERPLNSRGEWPLYLETEDDAIEVFDEGGAFTADMLRFLETN